MSREKRIFDLVVMLATVPLWLPVLLLTMGLILLFEGRPVFYVSNRRFHRASIMPIVKFRTMKKNAAVIANRETIPVSSQRFLNIPYESPLYTRVGRSIERFCITELPQLLHVFRGDMSIVGNRPLPENVVAALAEAFPNAEARFDVPCGLTGPTQLIGRDDLTDDERLHIEALYCRICQLHYSPRIDFMLLRYTVLICLHIRPKMTLAQVEDKLILWAGLAAPAFLPQPEPMVAGAAMLDTPRQHALLIDRAASFAPGAKALSA